MNILGVITNIFQDNYYKKKEATRTLFDFVVRVVNSFILFLSGPCFAYYLLLDWFLRSAGPWLGAIFESSTVLTWAGRILSPGLIFFPFLILVAFYSVKEGRIIRRIQALGSIFFLVWLFFELFVKQDQFLLSSIKAVQVSFAYTVMIVWLMIICGSIIGIIMRKLGLSDKDQKNQESVLSKLIVIIILTIVLAIFFLKVVNLIHANKEIERYFFMFFEVSIVSIHIKYLILFARDIFFNKKV